MRQRCREGEIRKNRKRNGKERIKEGVERMDLSKEEAKMMTEDGREWRRIYSTERRGKGVEGS